MLKYAYFFLKDKISFIRLEQLWWLSALQCLSVWQSVTMIITYVTDWPARATLLVLTAALRSAHGAVNVESNRPTQSLDSTTPRHVPAGNDESYLHTTHQHMALWMSSQMDPHNYSTPRHRTMYQQALTYHTYIQQVSLYLRISGSYQTQPTAEQHTTLHTTATLRKN